jgi:hypothetical protein
MQEQKSDTRGSSRIFSLYAAWGEQGEELILALDLISVLIGYIQQL